MGRTRISPPRVLTRSSLTAVAAVGGTGLERVNPRPWWCLVDKDELDASLEILEEENGLTIKP